MGTVERKKQIKKAFDDWYETKKNLEFNFQKEMFEYCFADVEILARGCAKYRELFLDISREDPFQYITIAQLCTKIYKSMIPEDTIGIMKGSSFEDIQSNKAIQWLEYLAAKENIPIRHAKRGGEVRIPLGTKYWKFDGYDEKQKHVYEFHGCYFHGCPKCFPNRDEINKRSNKTMEELYAKTIEREERIKNTISLHQFGNAILMRV